MDYQLKDLSGNVVLITGATSGIGKSTAFALTNLGVKLVLNARNSSKLQGVVEQLGPDNSVGVVGDCSDPRVTSRMADLAIQRFGKIDSVIANAGVGFFGSILDGSDEMIRETVNTNYIGTINLVRSAVPHLLLRQQGDILIVSSAAGYRGNKNEAVYAGTKHAQVGFAGSLERELSQKGIRVSLVCPAGTNTNFAFGQGRKPDEKNLESYMSPDDVAFQICTVLQLPKKIRIQNLNSWSMEQDS